MTWIVATLAFLSCSTAHTADATGQSSGLEAGDHEIALRHDRRARRFFVHVPATPRGGRLPVMVAYHGGGGNAPGFKAYAGLDTVADREGFVVVYPDGTGPLRSRLLTWNAGGCCGYAMERHVDDVGFTVAILDELARRLPIDPARVYATGHSNGAMMAYRLAAERADLVAAIVPVAGAMILESEFAPTRAVAVLHIHSVDDPRALYSGGLGPPFPLTNNRVMHRAVVDGLDRWIANNGCGSVPDTLDRKRGTPGSDSADHTATWLSWAPCGGFDVGHWKLTGAGHGWPGSLQAGLRESLVGPSTTVIDAAEVAWRFASRFRRTP